MWSNHPYSVILSASEESLRKRSFTCVRHNVYKGAIINGGRPRQIPPVSKKTLTGKGKWFKIYKRAFARIWVYCAQKRPDGLAEFASADAKKVRSFLREQVSRKNTAQFTNVRHTACAAVNCNFPWQRKGVALSASSIVNYFGFQPMLSISGRIYSKAPDEYKEV